MLPEMTQLQDLTERQLQLLHELIAELAGSRPALTAMDLDGIYSHVARQTFLCQRLEEIERERCAAWKAVATATGSLIDPKEIISCIRAIDESAAERLDHLQNNIAIAQRELRHQNRVHTLLIDGTRRTLAILANALASISPTYSLAPSAASSGPGIQP